MAKKTNPAVETDAAMAADDLAAATANPDTAADLVAGDPSMVADTSAKAAMEAETAAAVIAGAAADADTRTVTCLIAAGRRRGGRRWPAGPTTVNIADLSDEDWRAVEADPVLTVSTPFAVVEG